jgi:RNA polymerase sigma-70 factor, ECF subfamily
MLDASQALSRPVAESAAALASSLRDRELVIAARGGARWAAEALYRRHRRKAYRIASRLARPADRDDLVQDSFVMALSRLDRLRSPELFGSWLAAVVARTASRRFRRLRLVARVELEDSPPEEQLVSQAAGPDILAEIGTVRRVLELLPVEARLVFILRRVERMSIDEVAVHIGRSVATVKRRFADAQRLLDQGIARGRGCLRRRRATSG